jgi:hypothetical protein
VSDIQTPRLLWGGPSVRNGKPTSSTIGASTSGVQAGLVVAGVKRKAEDEEDAIDLTSDKPSCCNVVCSVVTFLVS